MTMLRTGSIVIHPVFPEWGKGVITKIFIDSKSSNHIAIVSWETVKASVHHTLNHLQPFETPAID